MKYPNLINDLLGDIEGGVAESIDKLLEDRGYPPASDLDRDTLAEIDEAAFTCEQCDWTMPADERSNDDDYLCRQCSEDR